MALSLVDTKTAAEVAAEFGGDAKPPAKPKKGSKKSPVEKPAKPPKGKKGNVEKAVREARKTARAAGEAGSDLTPVQAAKNLIKRYDQWNAASAKAAQVAKDSADSVKSAEERCREAIEAGRNVAGSTEERQQDAIEKVVAIETAWSGWQDAIAQSSKDRDTAKKAKKTAWKAVERAIDETRQLSMFE